MLYINVIVIMWEYVLRIFFVLLLLECMYSWGGLVRMWMMWFFQLIKFFLFVGLVFDVKKLSQVFVIGQLEIFQLKYVCCRKWIQICVLLLSGLSVILNLNRQSFVYKFQELEYWLSRKNLQFIDRVLYYKWDGKVNRSFCLVVFQGL